MTCLVQTRARQAMTYVAGQKVKKEKNWHRGVCLEKTIIRRMYPQFTDRCHEKYQRDIIVLFKVLEGGKVRARQGY